MPEKMRSLAQGFIGRIQEASPAGFVLGFNIGLLSADYMIQTYPRDWLKIYDAEGMLLKDVTVAWALRNTGSTRWSDLAPMDEAGVLRRAADHGLRFGATLSLLHDDRRLVAGFARSDREMSDDDIADCRASFIGLHDLLFQGGKLSPDVRAILDEIVAKA